MREVLFRGKTDNGEWVEGSLVILKNDYRIVTETDAQWAYTSGSNYDGDMTRVDASTVCQYTGLTDKNGNKIWENDILLQKTTKLHWCQWECMGVVKYGEHDWNELDVGYTSIGFYVEPFVKKGETVKIACGLNQFDINDECYPIEVIGNTFDNPELLKGE